MIRNLLQAMACSTVVFFAPQAPAEEPSSPAAQQAVLPNPALAPTSAVDETQPRAIPPASFEQRSEPASPTLARQLANVRKPPDPPSLFDYTEGKANVLKLTFAALLVALLVWSWNLADAGKGKKWRKERRFAIGLLGILGVFGWFNYGKFHGGNFVHVWEHYHYYIGAKYFPELRFARLYECSAIAEVEMGRRSLVEKRNMRDIAHTNLIGSTEDILAHPERCKEHFTEARWTAFKKDISFFIGRLGSRWADSQKDHGYNGTPWWNIGGSLLANLVGPASDTSMVVLALLDPLLLVAMFAGIWWAFGLEVFAVSATFFALNFPSRFYWNGGAFLRYDYLAWSVLGICFLKKKKPATGGALLAAGAAFRLFPIFFALGPAIQGGWRWFKDKAFPAEHKRIVVGALVATSLLVPASLVVARGGLEVYSEFAANTEKHAETPLTNHMGLRTVLSWRPWSNAKNLKDASQEDPFKTWKETRLDNYHQLKWLFLALNLIFLWGVWRTSRDEPAWVAAALCGVVMIPAATELTCYYYAFMIPGAFLMEKRREMGLWLILLAIGTHAITRMPIWDDDKYVWMGLASVAYGLLLIWTFLQPLPAGEQAPGKLQPALQPARRKA
ncbi:hypothetical protein [Vulgatibacter incomptus]|uniref:Glycosyltransferase RgtA/B/C/D-like domain-containing protein n=1 Tax=Vulgatibacter incomptus TaxID=1391653 RepID=A0A0K1PE26_9BACT|nr:hypothetical protein [Vulgatibacter incomptus]AKU91788.1 hypothetical protein AKJ08_2175 [Vulgatibacter incomptus]